MFAESEKLSIIKVLSFDFDGCIFNERYHTSLFKKRLVGANLKLIQHIIQSLENYNFSDVILMMGSNRQSVGIDDYSSFKQQTGSCFESLYDLYCMLRLHIPKCHLDKYLLADTFGNAALGENFSRALNNDSTYGYANSFMDSSKLLIVYAQMHKTASENPNNTIVYDFYDDSEEILNNLTCFFSLNLTLMPRNVIMQLHHYNGKNIEFFQQIIGKGEIDDNFEKNILLMMDCAGITQGGSQFYGGNLIGEFIHGERLTNTEKLICFINMRGVSFNQFLRNNYSHTLDHSFYKKQPKIETFDYIYTLALNRTPTNLRLLSHAKFDLNCKQLGISPIFKHAAEGNHHAVQFLIKAGASYTEAVAGYKSAGVFRTDEKVSDVMDKVQAVI